MSLANLDIPRLRKVLERIKDHPNEHDQGDWFTDLTYTNKKTGKTIKIFDDHVEDAYLVLGELNIDYYRQPGVISEELSQWSCNTGTACVAGHTALMFSNAIPIGSSSVWHDGREWEASGFACGELGVEYEDLYDPEGGMRQYLVAASHLFDAENDHQKTLEIGYRIIDEAEKLRAIDV